MTSPNEDVVREAPAVEDDQEQRQAPPVVETVTRGEPAGSSPNDGEDRGRPVGQWVAGAGSGLGIFGTALYETTGIVGLAAAAVVAAGGAVSYGVYRLRGQTSAFGKTTRTRRTSTRTFSGGRTGPKLGKGPKLFTGKNAGSGRGGPKLGKGGPKLGGGKSTKSGKGGGPRLFTGKNVKNGGASGGLGGKGRSATARMGSVGAGGSGRSSRGLLIRGGKAGVGLGKRGGRALGGKGRAGLGRWSKTTGDGAGVVGSKAARAARKAGRSVAAKARRSRSGRAVQAAKVAAAGTSGRWAKLRRAQAAARAKLGSPANPFARWSTSVGAGALALFALLQDRWRARRDPEAAEAAHRINTDVNDASTGAPLPPIPTPDHHKVSGRPIPTERVHTTMSQFPIATAASEMLITAGRYWPQTMWHVDQDLEQIDQLPLYLAQALQIYTKNLQAAYPVNPTVVEALGRMYVALGEVANSCEEIPKLFKQLHEDDIRRKTAPRIGEDKWNV